MVRKLFSGSCNFNKAWKVLVTLVLFSVSIALTGCSEERPMEKAGEKMDEAAEEVGDALEEAGDKMKDAVNN